MKQSTEKNESSRGAASIGVVIPSFNYGRFLAEAVESVLQQTRPVDQILIVDDGSTDDSATIGREFEGRYPSLIRFHSNETNLGVVENFNRAVNMLDTEYVCVLGADNRLRSDFIERTSALLDANHNVAVAYTDYALFGPRAQLEYNSYPEEMRGGTNDPHSFVIRFPDFTPDTRRTLRQRNFIHGSSLYRKSVFRSIGGYRGAASQPEEQNLFLRMIESGWDAVRVPLPLLEYRQHSLDQINTRQSMLNAVDFYRELAREGAARLAEFERDRVYLHETEAARAALASEAARVRNSLYRQNNEIKALKNKETSLSERTTTLETQLHQILTSRRWKLGGVVTGFARAPFSPRSSGAQVLRKAQRVAVKLGGAAFASRSKALVPRYFAAQHRGSISRVCFGWNGPGKGAVAVPCRQDRPIEWSVAAPVDSFEEVRVLVGTHGQRNCCHLELTITNQAGTETLRSVRSDMTEVLDNTFVEFRFEPLSVKPGTLLRFRLSSPNATAQHYVSIWRSPDLRPPHVIGTEGHRAGVDFVEPRYQLERDHDLSNDEKFIPNYFAVAGATPLAQTRFAIEKLRANYVAAPLLPGMSCSIWFKAPASHLREVQVLLGTYERQNRCKVRFELFELQTGRVLRSIEVSGESIQNNLYHRFAFEPIDDSEGVWYGCRITSPNSSSDDCLAVWGYVLPKKGGHYLGLEQYTQQPGVFSMVDTVRTTSDVAQFLQSPPPPFERRAAGAPRRALVVVSAESALTNDPDLRDVEKWLSAQNVEVRVCLDSFQDVYATLLDFDCAVLVGLRVSAEAKNFIRAARHARLPVLYFTNHELLQPRSALNSGILPGLSRLDSLRLKYSSNEYIDLVSCCDCFLSACDSLIPQAQALGRNSVLIGSSADADALLENVIQEYRRHRTPRISIVSILYAKEREISFFLEALSRQSYDGEFELILVDDCSPDSSRARALDFVARRNAANSGNPLEVRILENSENIGNCGSRNRGIAAATGDIIVVVDADCLLNKDFLASHARAHESAHVDVVIGPLNLETGTRDPLAALFEYEGSPERVEADAQLQDPINKRSFVNCITRNFSIKRSSIQGELFDELFAYSKRPDSGFGWEDVEMGARLYKQGAHIEFINDAFSVHVSHPPTTSEGTKPLRSLLNFRRLIEKHPDLPLIARRWVQDTYQKICAWIDSNGLPRNDDRAYLDRALGLFPQSAVCVRKTRPIRVLSYRWHCPHQYELYKLPYEFTLVQGLGPGFVDKWNYDQRPLPKNVRFMPIKELNLSEYDFAVLHFDENVLAPQNTFGILEADWGASFKWFRENVPLPKVAICHGTPQFIGQYMPQYTAPDLGTVISEERDRMVRFVGDMPVVLNSYQAQRDWGFQNSDVIWHGFDPSEFQLSSYRKGVLTLGGAMSERPHYRGYRIFKEVRERLPKEVEFSSMALPYLPSILREEPESYSVTKFDSYVKTIRDFSVYFNPTLRSPMPRSRGEAMMAGLVTVSANNHDVEMFIKNGYDGFYSNDPGELADYLLFLHRNPAALRQMGKRSREVAMDVFNHDRYLYAWQQKISAMVGA